MRFAVVVTIAIALTSVSRAQSIQPIPHIPGVFGDDSVLELVRDGFVFTEGPVGTADGGLYFTDTGAQPTRIYRLEADGRIRLFLDTLNRANGLALERSGALIAAESNGGRVIRVGTDGTVVPVVGQAAAGRPLINPNDLIADRRGGIYFTDFARSQRDAPGYVYYVPPGATQALVIASDVGRPNGLSLTDDEKTLIVDDSSGNTVYAFEIQPDGSAKSRQPFATLRNIPSGQGSGADGLTIDRAGRVVRHNRRRRSDLRSVGPISGHDSCSKPAGQCGIFGPGQANSVYHRANWPLSCSDGQPGSEQAWQVVSWLASRWLLPTDMHFAIRGALPIESWRPPLVPSQRSERRVHRRAVQYRG